jgi:hypothetical protein
MHQIGYFVLAIARFDKPEKFVALLLMASRSPIPATAVVNRLGPSVGHTAVSRAIKRLVRDKVVAAIERGQLEIVDPRSWPPHRVTDADLSTLFSLVGPTHNDQPVETPAAPEKPVHPAIAAAREAARRKREASKVPAPKLHQVVEDEVDTSWLDGDGIPDESKLKPATSCPLADDGDTTPTETKCATCANALDLLSSPLPGLAMWAKQHLSTCVLSPKGPGRPLSSP